jgi:hypothetical protein
MVAGNNIITQKITHPKSTPSKPQTRAQPHTPPMLTHSMATQKRIAASRQNGAKSHGPITDEGKARSSRNAIRHGLLSHTVVLDDEDPKEFKALLDQHVAKFQPNGDIEHQTVEEMAICRWKLRRLNIIETTLIDDHSRDNGYEDDADLSIAEAFVTHRHSIAQLERYSARLTRQYHRAFRHLQDLRQFDELGSFGKTNTPVPPPLPKPAMPASPANAHKPTAAAARPIALCPSPRPATHPENRPTNSR